jgi:ribosomal protein L40E
MGFLLKIILFGVALYGLWKTFRYWKGLFDRFTGNPEVPPQRPPQRPPASPPPADPPPQAPAPSARKIVVEDTVQCAGCGAYISTAAEKCGHCGRPRP